MLLWNERLNVWMPGCICITNLPSSVIRGVQDEFCKRKTASDHDLHCLQTKVSFKILIK